MAGSLAEILGSLSGSSATRRTSWIAVLGVFGALALCLFFVYQEPSYGSPLSSRLTWYFGSDLGGPISLRDEEAALKESLRRLLLQLSAFNRTLQGLEPLETHEGGVGETSDGLKCDCSGSKEVLKQEAVLECPSCPKCVELERPECNCPPAPECPDPVKQECNCPTVPKAEDTGLAPSEAAMKERVLECFRTRSACEKTEDDLCEANQVKVQAMRERSSRHIVRGQLQRLFDHPILERLKISLNQEGYAAAKKKLDKLPEGTNDDELWEFVMLFKIHRANLDASAKRRAELDAWVEAGERENERASARATSLEGESVECKGKLLERCGVQLPLDNWRSEQDKQIAAANGESVKPAKVTPSYEARIEEDARMKGGGGLRAPREFWKLQQRLYPDTVNVSFLLQYYNQPDNMKAIVERLYECTHGWQGDGQLASGITSELIVNVDEPGDVDKWIELWKQTDPGHFLVPVFQHNLHENRGFNRAAGVARGDVFILLQDDDIPPEDCGWVANVLAAFKAWPRLGVIGLKGGVFTIGASSVPRESKAFMGRFASWSDTMVFRDNSTNLRMQFVSVVDLAPMVFRRETYEEVGGMNESNGKKGEPGIMSDWEVSMRVWMAGWHVVQLYLEEKHRFGGGPSPGGTHVGIQAYLRGMNQGLNGQAFGWWVMDDYHERVYQEVKRMNRFLEGPSNPSMYI